MFDRRLYERRLAQLGQSRQITPAFRCVGLALLEYVGRDATCWPTHQTLADRAGTSAKTVQRALDALREVGLLSWQARRSCWNRRMSNLYTLLSPAALKVREKPISVPRPCCPADRPRSVAAQIAACKAPTAELQAALLARQARIEAGLTLGRRH